MATTKVSGELVDLRGGLPDFSLAATNTVSYLNAGGGNQYNFNGAYGLYGVVNGTYVLSSVSSSHPIAILNNGKTSLISYTGAVNEGSQTGPDGNTYTYYSGDVTITVSGNFDVVSYACKIHGYMGGQNNLIYTNLHSELGLKIPTGTNANRPATDVGGMIRNNTNESSDSSASCEEYYNGTAWKKINNVAFPPPLAFKTIIYSGNGSTQSITGVGFQPDLVWIKERGQAANHRFIDTSRGATKVISSSLNNAEFVESTGLTSFDTDGFTLGNNVDYNNNGGTFVAWCWKANGGTTSSNTDGSTTSTVQAYPEAGFSIVKYTGTGANASVGHGLGTDPKFIMIKKTSGASDWVGGALDWTKYLEPNGSPPFRTSNVWQDTAPTSSVFTLTTGGDSNGNGGEYIAYCFADADNVSKIGTYTGTGSTQTITTGFAPNLIITKDVSITDNWRMYDSVRGFEKILYPNLSDQEDDNNTFITGTESTGFNLGTGNGSNRSGSTYIYIAIKTN